MPEDSTKLRVPLVAKVDYQGFRAIAIAYIMVPSVIQPILGFINGQYGMHDEQLVSQLGYIGDSLNLKDNKTKKKGYSGQF